MKTTHLTRSIVAAVLLGGSATMLLAQDAANLPCPVGHAPGYGRKLTPEQRAGHRAAMQQQMTVLREKQANGTLTAEEQTWLKQAEERGGPCVTGTPRGPGAGKGLRAGQGAGKGPGAGQGRGRGHGRGLRDGTGPRNGDGTCVPESATGEPGTGLRQRGPR
jgi:hypothetical protein